MKCPHWAPLPPKDGHGEVGLMKPTELNRPNTSCCLHLQNSLDKLDLPLLNKDGIRFHTFSVGVELKFQADDLVRCKHEVSNLEE